MILCLRTYSYSRMPFKFNYVSNTIREKDKKALQKIEVAINCLMSDHYARDYMPKHLRESIDTRSMDFILPYGISLIVKSILNQYDIAHFDKHVWCGFRKQTIIKIDKIIARILASHNNLPQPPPIQNIVSNSIDIIPSGNSSKGYQSKSLSLGTTLTSKADTYKHDYLNLANKAQARKLRGAYNE